MRPNQSARAFNVRLHDPAAPIDTAHIDAAHVDTAHVDGAPRETALSNTAEHDIVRIDQAHVPTAESSTDSQTRSTHSGGTHEQFLRSFMLHEATVRAYVRRLLPSRADADDVAQEVAVVLWAKFHQFREGGDFCAWALGIARYQVLAWLRDRGRDRLVLDADVIELLADDKAADLRPLIEQRQALEACLEKLDPKHRAMLLESYGSGHRIQDVAKSSGRSLTGFYQWLHRMRRLLLDCIKKEVANGKCR